MNLFEGFDEVVNHDFIKQMKSLSNDNLGDVEVAMKGVFYTLLAGLIRRTDSDMSSGMLFNQIKEKYKNNSIPLDKLSIFEKKATTDNVTDSGSKIISQIFPAYKSPLLSMIGSYANTSKNTTVLVSGITASLLVDLLGKQITDENMDKESLVYFLKQHHELLLQKAPDALLEKMIPALGLQELVNSKIVPMKKPEPNTKKNEELETPRVFVENQDNESETFFNKKVLIALVALLIIGGAAYFFWSTTGGFGSLTKEEPPVESLDQEMQFVDSLSNVAEIKVKADTSAAASKTVPATVSEKEQFQNYILDPSQRQGKEFDFTSIQFVDKTYELTAASFPVIDELASLMNSNQKVQIKVIGFSEENYLKLNNKRAFAIKKVLLSKGVNTIRIDAGSGGKGGNFPRLKVVSK
jgi:outer membrane protein OmpA-like peptidoglycan-associated protein